MTTAVGSGSTPAGITFGTGTFEITSLSMSSRSASDILPTAVFWLRSPAEGGRALQTQECLMSGFCGSTLPLALVGSKFVEGPGRLYSLTNLGAGAASLATMRVAYRRVSR